MLHSDVRNWLHVIWATFDRKIILNKEIRVKLFEHYINISNEMKIPIEKHNIQAEHVHMLLNLPADKTISDTVKRFKGESSRWINENNLLGTSFKWQRGYGAFSVSASQFEIVKTYIENQNEHHRKITFTEEYNEWRVKYGIPILQNSQIVEEDEEEYL